MAATDSTSYSEVTESVTLAPDYRLCAAIALLGLPLYTVSLFAMLPVELFAVFLTIQAATLRLVFAGDGLQVFRGQTQIRYFPYADWHHWEIYWPTVPILFYFREVNSIHFLPVIFNSKQLRQSLESRVPLDALANPQSTAAS